VNLAQIPNKKLHKNRKFTRSNFFRWGCSEI
jgi:hypothetical protein